MANKKARQKNENIIPVQDLIFHCLSKWYWFIISTGMALLLAVLYILSTPPVYMRSTEILFKEEGQGSSGGRNSAFKEIGSAQVISKTENEIKVLTSTGIMREVVDSLSLDIEYQIDGTFFRGIIYSQRPFTVKTLDLRRSDAATFTTRIKNDSCILLSDFAKNGNRLSSATIEALSGDTVQTPLGRVYITATEHIRYYDTDKDIYIEKKIYEATVNEFCSKLSAGLVNEESSIVRISIKDVSVMRAADILNAITDIYNKKWIEESNIAAIGTAEFIQKRADELNRELREIDNRIAKFKSRNRITSNTVAGELPTADNEKLIVIGSQLELAKFIKSHLENNSRDVIPTNTGIEIAGFESLITNYNTTLANRNRLAANSSDTNPIVMGYDNKLMELHATISSAVESYIANKQRELGNIRREEANEIRKISASSDNLKDLEALTRQQKIKNTLYLFLLQKLEETRLGQEFVATNNRVLVPVSGSNTPIEPMQRQSITLALVIGLLAPVVFIFVREVTNRKIRGRKDIENLTVPFVGEIPLCNGGRKRYKKGPEKRSIVVKEGKRDVINEAFRVLRTNVEFMNDKEKRSQVIILTSFNPGSGKTFLTVNIAASFAIKNSKVLVIDGDMRHGSASEFAGSPSRGISDYLSGATNDIESIKVTDTGFPGLHIIPVGETPPNPTELLHSNKFRTLLEKMKDEYDYIFIDCPPIDIIADTQIIEENADRTLFVIRAGLLNRDMLYELEDIYDEKRLKNMAVILNGTYSNQGRYGYRYGYSYGYGYGYGYGYHYHQKK